MVESETEDFEDLVAISKLMRRSYFYLTLCAFKWRRSISLSDFFPKALRTQKVANPLLALSLVKGNIKKKFLKHSLAKLLCRPRHSLCIFIDTLSSYCLLS